MVVFSSTDSDAAARALEPRKMFPMHEKFYFSPQCNAKLPSAYKNCTSTQIPLSPNFEDI